MTRTVTRLFNTHTEAMAAVSALEAAGIPHDDISLVANNTDGWHDGHRHPHDAPHVDSDSAGGAGKGATTGGLIGGAGGLLAGLGMLAIPGVGPVVAAGWLVSTAVGAVAGAAVGGATGGLLGSLKDAGHTDEDAQVYAEGVRRGGALVSVRASDAQASEAESILQSRAGVDAADRGGAYRETGWTGYSADAPAYSADEIAAERRRFQTAESRSFAASSHETGATANDLGPASERQIGSPDQKPFGSGV